MKNNLEQSYKKVKKFINMKNNLEQSCKKMKKSMRGKWGKVGAPIKAVQYPRSCFTIASVVKLNKGDVCDLTIRNRIKSDIKRGKLVRVGTLPQPKGQSGRPQLTFILKELATKLKPAKTTLSSVKATQVTSTKTSNKSKSPDTSKSLKTVPVTTIAVNTPPNVPPNTPADVTPNPTTVNSSDVAVATS
jgi:hypothetical protein